MSQNLPTKVGQCEICEADNTRVQFFHKLWVCDSCYKDESDAAETLNTLVTESREIDNKIQLKQDIFNAKTIAAIELKGAIDNDAAIPADQKDYMLAKEMQIRRKKIQQAIFEKRQELDELGNEERMWQTQLQTTVGRLRADLRAQFAEMNVHYQPTPVKSVKSAATGHKRTKKFGQADLNQLKEAAKKYNVPYQQVQSIAVSRNLAAEPAAKMLAEMLGILPKN